MASLFLLTAGSFSTRIEMMHNYPLMVNKDSGSEELPHTADWAIHVWAGSLPALFTEAARGMNALLGVKPGSGTRVSRTFLAEAPDVESLLVTFLSELVWAVEQENLVFDTFKVVLKGPKLKVIMSGVPILSLNKSIKAVTYHNLQIRRTEDGFQVEIVFDV
jgi:SHS2 domain-containing protein